MKFTNGHLKFKTYSNSNSYTKLFMIGYEISFCYVFILGGSMRKVKNVLGINEIHRKGITGKGVCVAILDSGIASHPDLKNQIVAFKDFVNDRNDNYDDEGHGTHVAGIIGGNGKLSRGLMCGIAPEVDIVSLKVLDKHGRGKERDVIEGIRWIIDNGKKYNIKAVNISFGTTSKTMEENNQLIDAVELLWDLGYVVIAAAGNNGPGASSVSTPGDSRKIITVGAENDNIKTIVNGKMTKNYSGRGPTKQCIQKPDIVAPANDIFSCCNLWERKYFYVSKSGTSMATPVVTGIVCLMLSQYNLTNVECKKMIRDTAIDLKLDKNRQGWGRINPEKMFGLSGN
mgnify:CR=1 FL=1